MRIRVTRNAHNLREGENVHFAVLKSPFSSCTKDLFCSHCTPPEAQGCHLIRLWSHDSTRLPFSLIFPHYLLIQSLFIRVRSPSWHTWLPQRMDPLHWVEGSASLKLALCKTRRMISNSNYGKKVHQSLFKLATTAFAWHSSHDQGQSHIGITYWSIYLVVCD